MNIKQNQKQNQQKSREEPSATLKQYPKFFLNNENPKNLIWVKNKPKSEKMVGDFED